MHPLQSAKCHELERKVKVGQVERPRGGATKFPTPMHHSTGWRERLPTPKHISSGLGDEWESSARHRPRRTTTGGFGPA